MLLNRGLIGVKWLENWTGSKTKTISFLEGNALSMRKGNCQYFIATYNFWVKNFLCPWSLDNFESHFRVFGYNSYVVCKIQLSIRILWMKSPFYGPFSTRKQKSWYHHSQKRGKKLCWQPKNVKSAFVFEFHADTLHGYSFVKM